MPRIDEATKTQRLERLRLLLARHARGLTEAEIAEELRLERRTANNYLRELEDQGKAFKDGLYWFPLVLKESSLRPLELSPEEAVALYLGARLLAKQHDKRNEPAETALFKLAAALRADAGVGDEIEQAARELAGRPAREGYQPVFREVVRGYIYRKKIALTYRPLGWGRPFETLFSTYLIEPSPVGFSTYLIGHSSIVDAQRAYKLERVEAARLTREDYAVPPDFPGLEVLKDAWSIVLGEACVKVVLRFSPAVRERVLESRWHPSQQTLDDAEKPGWLLWEVQVADTLDLVPWVRSWGADCEVLEPEGLRRELKSEARRIAKVYGIENQEDVPVYFHLWAKAEKNQTPDVHLLIYHLMDVGACAWTLWNHAISAQTRRMLAAWLDLDEEAAGRQIAFWASLHDLGKAAPGFQRRYKPRLAILEGAGFNFLPEKDMNPIPASHGILSAWALTELLGNEIGPNPRMAARVAAALGGHHGVWPTNDRVQPPALQASDKGDETWDNARRQIFEALKKIYSPPDVVNLPQDRESSHTFLTLFSGLVSVADWIGSCEQFFPFVDEHMLPAEYAQKFASPQAEIVLEELGWIGWQAEGAQKSFDSLFPKTPIPNEIQCTTLDLASQSTLPALLILEAPTGVGKTEAALALADAWLERERGSGLYIAMPTQATSNQMYGRVIDFLRSRYPDQAINAHLVHGAALLAEGHPVLAGIAQDEASAERGVKAQSWFLPRKRTLLAPFGVGTVDQALMSVLQTRHFFVRLFGLGQKVVVFDEIHAYDTYMSELFQRLLLWLRTMGTSAVLLSATLPEKTRRALVAAWLGKDDEEEIDLPPAEYPRLTLVSGGQIESKLLPSPASRILRLDWAEPGPAQIATHLAEKLRDGGCAAVICNRVQRAQEIYQVLQATHLVESENLILFHARFPFNRREEIEEKVLEKFGKEKEHPNQPNPNRPRRAVVVATQVIEQSLDLDFDYMISDLAPVDLLLQRAGRLQRHSQNDASRPGTLSQPVMAITLPAMKDSLPDFGRDIWIYSEVILLRTWLTLHGRREITLPHETSSLIEQVYPLQPNDEQFAPGYHAVLRATAEKARLQEDKDVHNAVMRLVRQPAYEGLMTDRNEELEEDDPKAGQAFRALTRQGEPSVSLICLYDTPQGIALEIDGDGAPLDISKRPGTTLVRELLRRAVNVQRKDVVHYIVTNDNRAYEWKKSAAVRDHFPILFDANCEYHPEGAGFILKLSRELGLQVFKTSKEPQ